MRIFLISPKPSGQPHPLGSPRPVPAPPNPPGLCRGTAVAQAPKPSPHLRPRPFHFNPAPALAFSPPPSSVPPHPAPRLQPRHNSQSLKSHQFYSVGTRTLSLGPTHLPIGSALPVTALAAPLGRACLSPAKPRPYNLALPPDLARPRPSPSRPRPLQQPRRLSRSSPGCAGSCRHRCTCSRWLAGAPRWCCCAWSTSLPWERIPDVT